MEIIANRSQPLSSQYTIRAAGHTRSQILIINDAQWRDVGVYGCIASINNGIKIEAETSLDVFSELYNTSLTPTYAILCCLSVQFLSVTYQSEGIMMLPGN